MDNIDIPMIPLTRSSVLHDLMSRLDRIEIDIQKITNNISLIVEIQKQIIICLKEI